MTPHEHTEIVPGCYRCEISSDEVTPPQEPRTGGVLVRWDGGYGMFVPNSYGTQTHRVFPLAEAEALIDPNDPAVRERIAESITDLRLRKNVTDAQITDAVLAALRSKS